MKLFFVYQLIIFWISSIVYHVKAEIIRGYMFNVIQGSTNTEKDLLINLFNQYKIGNPLLNDVELELEYFKGDRTFYINKVEENMQANKFDFYMVDMTSILADNPRTPIVKTSKEFYEKLIDITPVIGNDEKEIHDKYYFDHLTLNGKIYGLPFVGEYGLLYYRSDLLQAIGRNEPPKDWDELIEMVNSFRNSGANNNNCSGLITQLKPYEDLSCNFFEWIHSYSHIGNDTEREVMVKSSELLYNEYAQEAIKNIYNLKTMNIIPETSYDYDEEETNKEFFFTKSALFMRGWSNAYKLISTSTSTSNNQIPENNTGMQTAQTTTNTRIGVTTLPNNFGVRGGWALVVANKNDITSEKAEKVIEVIKYLTSKNVQRERTVNFSITPTVNLMDAENAEYCNYLPCEAIRNVKEVSRLSHVLYNRESSTYNEVSKVIFTDINKVILAMSEDTFKKADNSYIENILKMLKVVYVDWDNKEAIFFYIVAIICNCVQNVLLLVFVVYRKHVVIQRSSPLFCLIFIFSVGMSYNCVFFDISFVSPTRCQIQPMILSIFFGVAISSLLAKTWRIYRIFHNPNLRIRGISLSNKALLIIIAAITFVEILINTLWMTISPRSTFIKGNSNERYPICSGKYDTQFFTGLISYNALLVFLTCYFAYRTRKVYDEYNEARSIGLSMWTLVILSCVYIFINFFGDNIGYRIKYVTTYVLLGIIGMSILLIMVVPKLKMVFLKKNSSSSGWKTSYSNPTNPLAMNQHGHNSQSNSYNGTSSNPERSQIRNIWNDVHVISNVITVRHAKSKILLDTSSMNQRNVTLIAETKTIIFEDIDVDDSTDDSVSSGPEDENKNDNNQSPKKFSLAKGTEVIKKQKSKKTKKLKQKFIKLDPFVLESNLKVKTMIRFCDSREEWYEFIFEDPKVCKQWKVAFDDLSNDIPSYITNSSGDVILSKISSSINSSQKQNSYTNKRKGSATGLGMQMNNGHGHFGNNLVLMNNNNNNRISTFKGGYIISAGVGNKNKGVQDSDSTNTGTSKLSFSFNKKGLNGNKNSVKSNSSYGNNLPIGNGILMGVSNVINNYNHSHDEDQINMITYRNNENENCDIIPEVDISDDDERFSSLTRNQKNLNINTNGDAYAYNQYGRSMITPTVEMTNYTYGNNNNNNNNNKNNTNGYILDKDISQSNLNETKIMDQEKKIKALVTQNSTKPKEAPIIDYPNPAKKSDKTIATKYKPIVIPYDPIKHNSDNSSSSLSSDDFQENDSRKKMLNHTKLSNDYYEPSVSPKMGQNNVFVGSNNSSMTYINNNNSGDDDDNSSYSNAYSFPIQQKQQLQQQQQQQLHQLQQQLKQQQQNSVGGKVYREDYPSPTTSSHSSPRMGKPILKEVPRINSPLSSVGNGNNGKDNGMDVGQIRSPLVSPIISSATAAPTSPFIGSPIVQKKNLENIYIENIPNPSKYVKMNTLNNFSNNKSVLSPKLNNTQYDNNNNYMNNNIGRKYSDNGNNNRSYINNNNNNNIYEISHLDNNYSSKNSNYSKTRTTN